MAKNYSFEQVRTSQAFKTFRITGDGVPVGTFLHDTQGKHHNHNQIVDASVEALGEPTVGEQLSDRRNKGVYLGTPFNHYHMNSIDGTLYISSIESMAPVQTRPIASAYLKKK